MEQLANLPPAALITFGGTLAVIYAVRFLGLWQGQKASPSASATAAQVAAVIVDPTALNAATAAVKGLTDELQDSRVRSADNAHMIGRRIEGLTEEVSELSRAVSALMVELARKPG